MGSWTLLLALGSGLAGVLVFVGLVADEIAAIEVHLAHRSRLQDEQLAKQRARRADSAG